IGTLERRNDASIHSRSEAPWGHPVDQMGLALVWPLSTAPIGLNSLSSQLLRSLRLLRHRATVQRPVIRKPKDTWHSHHEPIAVWKREEFDADVHVLPELDRPGRESGQRRP